MSLDKLGVNIYLDQMLVGLVEICASIFAAYIIIRVERKKYCKISFLLVSLFTTTLGVLTMIETH